MMDFEWIGKDCELWSCFGCYDGFCFIFSVEWNGV
jgi:hypothetical protein